MKSMLVVTLALLSTSAFARESTLNMTCAQANALVQRSGAVVLSTGEGIYARFVANSSFCGARDSTVPAYVPTRDSRSCFIGYVCTSGGNGGGYFRAPVRGCVEGARETVLEDNGNNSDATSPVSYICRDGKWQREFGGSSGGQPVGPQGCREGEEETVYEDRGNGEGWDPVRYICRGGVWKRKF